MMRRLPHGATTRPGPSRPTNGYGRIPGRPGPNPAAQVAARAHRRFWHEATVLVDTDGRIHRAGRTRVPESVRL